MQRVVDFVDPYDKPFEALITALVLSVRRPRDVRTIELVLEREEGRALLMLMPLADKNACREEASRRGDMEAIDAERLRDETRSHDVTDERHGSKKADMVRASKRPHTRETASNSRKTALKSTREQTANDSARERPSGGSRPRQDPATGFIIAGVCGGGVVVRWWWIFESCCVARLILSICEPAALLASAVPPSRCYRQAGKASAFCRPPTSLLPRLRTCYERVHHCCRSLLMTILHPRPIHSVAVQFDHCCLPRSQEKRIDIFVHVSRCPVSRKHVVKPNKPSQTFNSMWEKRNPRANKTTTS